MRRSLTAGAEDVTDKALCTVTLNKDNVDQLHMAIEDLYYFEFIIDDLPARGFIGQLVEHVLPHSHEARSPFPRFPMWRIDLTAAPPPRAGLPLDTH